MMKRTLLAVVLSTLVMGASTAHAGTTRLYESSFGTFNLSSPDALAVDQANGDVYALTNEPFKVVRFDGAGNPKNFTAGTGAGTNTLFSYPFPLSDVAVDNSGGPLDGTVYVGNQHAWTVEVFSRTGAKLATLDGSKTFPDEFGERNFGEVHSVAVDQTNGDLYIATGSGETWRYSPTQPSGDLDEADYAITGIQARSNAYMAAHDGRVYLTDSNQGVPRAEEYQASSFTLDPVQVEPVLFPGESYGVDVDPETGEVLVSRAYGVEAFSPSGTPLYRFASGAKNGDEIAGMAAKAGPVSKVYLADQSQGGNQIDVYGAPTAAPVFTHTKVGLLQVGDQPRALTFDPNLRRLYVGTSDGIAAFDASAPPAYPPVGESWPQTSVSVGGSAQLAVDRTALASAGNVYLLNAGVVHGFDSSGAPLGGAFPLDPAVNPGAPNGSPKLVCGVAVDSTGRIFVSNSQTKKILIYSAAGAFQSAIDTTTWGSPCRLAIDSADNLYASMNGIWKVSAASGYTSATQINPQSAVSLAVDPATGRLFAVHSHWLDEYDSSGNLIDEFGQNLKEFLTEVAVDPTNGFVHLGLREAHAVQVFGPGVLLPEVTIEAASALGNGSATLNGSVGTQGEPLTDCYFEYVTEKAFRVTGFSDLGSGGSAPCMPAFGSIPADLGRHAVSASVSGLSKKTSYLFRLVAVNADGNTVSPEEGFDTLGSPEVETVGAPIRTATTARFEGRLNPRGSATTYRFEYGTAGPCESNPCQQTEPLGAGAGRQIVFVSQLVEGLEPGTTYHYRLVADNANPDGLGVGQDMTVTTRSSDEPLDHGHLPGPPESDRAWEQVNVPDTGGNPLLGGLSFSDDGERVVYQIPGGTPITDSGSLLNQYFAERTADGWVSVQTLPSRDQVVGPNWLPPAGDAGLKNLVTLNANVTTGARAIWRLHPGGPPELLLSVNQTEYGDSYSVSEDGLSVVAMLTGTIDPAHPVAADKENIYDLDSGEPRLVSFLPDGSVPPCGARGSEIGFSVPFGASRRPIRLLSPDGRYLVFPANEGSNCNVVTNLYLRDIPAETTTQLSGMPISGPVCGAGLIKQADGAVFFWTQERLVAGDVAPTSCADESQDGDVYRYDIGSKDLRCLTCLFPDLSADVNGEVGASPSAGIAVAGDGSRVYFETAARLLPGAASPGAYRVNVQSGELAYVAPIGTANVGDLWLNGNALNPDGSVLIFRSDASGLNQVNGAHNGGTAQYYRYDDRDRSLLCVSCPQDGSPAVTVVNVNLATPSFAPEAGNNADPLSHAGDVFVFATPNPLVGADQNTPSSGDRTLGTDVYEWRDGRVLLVSDGITRWPKREIAPNPSGVSPSGRDVFFTASAAYTADALDGYNRLYDARIGGGFEFPPPPKPCALEVCQGTPKGAPTPQQNGTRAYPGESNVTTPPRRPCKKGKVRRNGRCVKKKAGKKKKTRAARNGRR